MSDLAEHVESLASGQGFWPTLSPDLCVFKYTQPVARTYVTYSPCLCIVAQGEKRALIDGREVLCDPGIGMVVGLPRAAESEAPTASADSPVMGVVLELDLNALGRVALEIGLSSEGDADESAEPHAFVQFGAHSELTRAMGALLRHAQDPLRLRVLYPGSLREVFFHLLTGAGGRAVHAMVTRNSRNLQILTSVRFIDQHFKTEVRVPELARSAGMSESLYYRKFREVLSMTPLQYLKRVRLQHARIMMMNGRGVAEAAFEVGYGSPSHFSRDFRSLYGYAPSSIAPGGAPAVITLKEAKAQISPGP